MYKNDKMYTSMAIIDPTCALEPGRGEPARSGDPGQAHGFCSSPLAKKWFQVNKFTNHIHRNWLIWYKTSGVRKDWMQAIIYLPLWRYLHPMILWRYSPS